VEQGGLSSATEYEVSKLEDPVAQAELVGAMVEQKLTRSEVAAAVQAVKSRRTTPAPEPGLATFDLGECRLDVMIGIGPRRMPMMTHRATPPGFLFVVK
jgi:hypothetical protein